jgi:hypothetical protein
MAELIIQGFSITVPVVTLTTISLVKKRGDRWVICADTDALVWDPNVVRALLDEKVYRNPVLALIVPTATGQT